MREYETLPTTYRRETRCICDMCGEEVVERNHDVMDVTVEAKYGERDYYGGGARGKCWSADICLVCFKDKVVPALEALGVKITWTDWEY